MVLPEGGDGPTRSKRTGRGSAFLIAVVVLGCGALLFAVLTTPDQIQAIDETTTTTRPLPPPTRPTLVNVENFDVTQIETGTQLRWTPAGQFEDFYPFDLVRHDGFIYLLASTATLWDPSSGGMAVWRSTDGTDWVTIGEVLDPSHKITSVGATAQGLVAIESAEEGLVVWRSSNGEIWAPETIASEAVSGSRAFATSVGGNDRLLVVYGYLQFDPTEMLEERIEATYGVSVDLTEYGYSPNFGPEDMTITIHGPLGLPVLTASADDMGLSEDERSTLQHGNIDEESLVWASWDGGEWAQSQIEGLGWVNSIAARDDGSLVAVGWGNTGANIWVSYDGIIWEEERVHPEPSTIERWGDRFVGPDSIGDASILTSVDGIEWEETGVEQHLPRPIGWSIGPMAASERGIAAYAGGWHHVALSDDDFADPPVLTDGDLAVTIDFQSGRLDVAFGEDTRDISLWGASVPDGLEVDLARELVVFSDPQTGEEWGSLTFGELRDAEANYWPHYRDANPLPVFLYSADGETWNLQGLEDELGVDSPYVATMEMTEDGRVVIVVQTEPFAGPDGEPGFGIWAADLP